MTFVSVVNEHEDTKNCISNDFGPVLMFAVYLHYSFEECLRLEVVVGPSRIITGLVDYLLDGIAKRVHDFVDGVIVFVTDSLLRLIVIDNASD